LTGMRSDIDTVLVHLVQNMLASNPSHRPVIQEILQAFEAITSRSISDYESTARSVGRESDAHTGTVTNQLFLMMADLPPDTQCIIEDVYQIYGQVQISLADGTDLEQGTQWFAVEVHLNIEGTHYLLLRYPPDMTEDWDEIPIVAVRIGQDRTVSTISGSELRAIAKMCSQALSQDNPLNIDELSNILEPIRIYKSAEVMVQD
jgi:hypothetical protein